VTSTYDIDLSHFELPACQRVKFEMIDPVYVWIQQCRELWRLRKSLVWQPKILYHPDTREKAYGGGIEYSKIMRAAYDSLGKPGRIALFNINWDGGSAGFGSRSCTPIHVQVMNTNSSSTAAIGLVGYIPYISVPEGYRQEKNYMDARDHVLQVRVRLRNMSCRLRIISSSSTYYVFFVYVIYFVCLRKLSFSST
jgi:hypothetical protein